MSGRVGGFDHIDEWAGIGGFDHIDAWAGRRV